MWRPHQVPRLAQPSYLDCGGCPCFLCDLWDHLRGKRCGVPTRFPACPAFHHEYKYRISSHVIIVHLACGVGRLVVDRRLGRAQFAEVLTALRYSYPCIFLISLFHLIDHNFCIDLFCASCGSMHFQCCHTCIEMFHLSITIRELRFLRPPRLFPFLLPLFLPFSPSFLFLFLLLPPLPLSFALLKHLCEIFVRSLTA
jgi:hypothetical protein